jgi:hypothetical protein
MMCVRTATYAVLINGNPVGRIYPFRGIRQGDPISLYLFLLCAETFSSLLTQVDREGFLEGVPTSRRGPRINHLLFAYDNLLFYRASIEHWQKLTDILQDYELASGQCLNHLKTEIFFSCNTPTKIREKIAEVSGIPASQRYDTYLGLLALIGKSRIAAFQNIKEKVWKRLQDWKLKFLSQAGKEILLKVVIQAIPAYSMGVFLLPKASEINSLMQRFWWGHQAKDFGIPWMSWSRMGFSKEKGGMGFRDLHCFNKTLLAKQIWRMWKMEDSLTTRIMKAKYFPSCSILEAQLGNKPSYA